MSNPYVLHVQQPLTGEWLYHGVPFTTGTYTRSLTAPAAQIVIEPDIWVLKSDKGTPVFNEWASVLYVERDKTIQWGGILSHVENVGQKKTCEFVGYSTFPNGVVYKGSDYSKVGIDAMDAFEYMWSWLQSQARANLGLQIDNRSSTIKVGTTDEPYVLSWYNSSDLGSEIQNLQQLVPFEFIEEHAWNSDRTAVSHRLKVGVPRIGTSPDVKFVQGENIIGEPTITRDGASYANEVIGIGAGDGSTTVQSISTKDDGRLWRPIAYTDKSKTKKAELQAATDRELAAKSALGSVDTITVNTGHRNAPLGSFDAGDDVPVTVRLGWGNPTTIKHRITEMTVDMVADTVDVTMARSDSFSYIGATQ